MQPINIQVALEDLISAAVEAITEQVTTATEAVTVFGEDASAAFDLVTETTQSLAASVDEMQGAFVAAFGDIVPAVQTMTETMVELRTTLLTLNDSLTATVSSLGQLGSDLYINTIATQDNTAAVIANNGAQAENAAATSAANAAKDAGSKSTANLSSQFNAMRGPVLIATAALVGTAAAAILVGANYESAMAVVQGLTGQSADTMKALDKQVLAMAADMGVAPKKIADGLYYLLSAGIDTNHVIDVMKTVLQGSSAAMVDQATYANVLTTYMKAFGASQDEARKYSDKLIQTVVDGKTTFQALAMSFGQAATAAVATHVSADELAGSLDVLTVHGYSAQRAEQNLGTTMMDLGLKTASIEKNAKKLGIAFDESKFKTMSFQEKLMYLWDQSGKNSDAFEHLFANATAGKVAFALLSNNGADLAAAIKKISDASTDGGATLKAYNVYQQTTGYLWNQVKASGQVALIAIYRDLQPLINAFLKDLMPALKNFTDWVTSHGPEVQKIFTGLAVAVAGMGATFVLLGPVGKMIEHLGVVGNMASKGLKDGFGPVKTLFDGATTAGGKFGGMLGNVTQWVPQLVGHMGRFGGTLLEVGRQLPIFAQVGMTQVGPMLRRLSEGFFELSAVKLPQLLGMLTNGSTYLNLFKGAGTLLMTMIEGGLPALGAFAGGLAAVLGPILLIIGAIAIIVLLFTKFRTQTMQVVETLFGALKPSIEDVKKSFAAFIGGIEKEWNKAWPQVKSAMDGLLSALSNLKPVVEIVGAVLSRVFGLIFTILGAVIGAFIRALPAIISFFTGIFRVIGQFGALVEAVFHGQWGKIPGILGNIIGGIWQTITSGLGAVKDFVWGFISKILDFFKHLWDQLVGHSIIPDMINGIIAWFKSLPGKVIAFIAYMVEMLLKHAKALQMEFLVRVEALVRGILSKISGAASGIFDAAKSLATNALKGLQWLVDQAPGLIPKLIDGMVNLLSSQGSRLVDGLKNMAGNALDGLKNAFGIHSPSTLTHEMGLNLMAGLINGFSAVDGAAAFAAHVSGIGAKASLSGALGNVRRLGTVLGDAGTGAGAGNNTIHIHLEGGIGDGWLMLNGAQRTQIAQLLAQEFAKHTNMQRNLSNGYTGV